MTCCVPMKCPGVAPMDCTRPWPGAAHCCDCWEPIWRAFYRPLAWPLNAVGLLMAVCRLSQALRVLTLRASLAGHAMQQLNTQQLAQWCPAPEQVFLGFGFEWQPHHSPRLYKLTKLDCRQGWLRPGRCAGVRLDFTFNWQKPTEIDGAARVHRWRW